MGDSISRFISRLEVQAAAAGGSATFDGGSVEWAPGFSLVKRAGVRGVGVGIYSGVVRFQDDDCEVVIEVEVAEVDQEHRVKRLEVFPSPGTRLTGRGVRTLNLGEKIATAMTVLSIPVVSNRWGDPSPVGTPGRVDPGISPRDLAAAQRVSTSDGRFRLLERVADTYKQAIEDGVPTSRAICDRVPGVPSLDAARQRVREARAVGLLDPTDPGKKAV